MEVLHLEKPFWSLDISVTDGGICFEGGHFRELSVLRSPVFKLCLENLDHESFTLDSASDWSAVRCVHDDTQLQFWLSGCALYGDITVAVTGKPDEKGISWYMEVINHSDTYSVTEISYPTPLLKGEPLHLFVPDCCGRAIMHAGERGFKKRDRYPGHNMSMQYFAWWGEKGGIYLGVHDPDACMKRFAVQAKEHRGDLQILFPAIGSGTVANSFCVAG